MRHLLWPLLVVTLLSRLPFAAGEPYSWDSYNYHLAVEHFRPAEDMAHFPGYFNYVMAVRPLAAVFDDPNAALVGWSVLMGVLLVGLMFTFARGPVAQLLHIHRHDAGRLALVAAVLTAVNPMVWFYSAVALGYINGAVAGIVAVWSILAPKRAWWQWILPPLLIGWLTGFRLETAALGLLWVRQGLEERVPGKVWLLGVAAGFVGMALWMLPTAAYAGGWEAYWRQGASLLARSSDAYQAAHGGFLLSMLVNLARLTLMLLLAAGFGLLPLALRPGATRQVWQRLPRGFTQVVLWWTLPLMALLYFFFLLPGYLLLIQPALTLVAAALLVRTTGSGESLKRRLAVAGVLSVLYFAAPYSLLLAERPPPPMTGARIEWSDTRAHDLRAILGMRLDPGSAAIVCYDDFYPWRAAMIDFPDVPAYQIVDAPGSRFVVEGYRKRERGAVPHSNGALVEFPDSIRHVAVVRREDDARFARDFPGFVMRDSVMTGFGTLYFAERVAPPQENVAERRNSILHIP